MSIFPTKVLLATDGSRDAELALSTAAYLANSTGSELHVVTVAIGNPHPVYQIHEASLRYETYEEALEAVRAEAQRVLDEQVQKVREAGGTITQAHLRIGEPRDRAIVHLADELGAGLIVMGSRGLGGIRRALMGSVLALSPPPRTKPPCSTPTAEPERSHDGRYPHPLPARREESPAPGSPAVVSQSSAER